MSSRRVESFVIRIVVNEANPIEQGMWNGRIQHITTGEELQFKQLNDLLSFMAARLPADQSTFTAPKQRSDNEVPSCE
mgnify:CR=1 FL=1|jgi:hypothetical protein